MFLDLFSITDAMNETKDKVKYLESLKWFIFIHISLTSSDNIVLLPLYLDLFSFTDAMNETKDKVKYLKSMKWFR